MIVIIFDNNRLCLFRVQTVSSRPAFGQSAWTDVLVVKRQQPPSTTHQPSTQQQQPQLTSSSRQPAPPPSQQQQQQPQILQNQRGKRGSTNSQQAQPVILAEIPFKPTAAAPSTASAATPQKPPPCAAPRLTALSATTVRINWRLASSITNGCSGSPKKTATAGVTLLFELQRVDGKQPSNIIYSGIYGGILK
jgi:hypothetical protein